MTAYRPNCRRIPELNGLRVLLVFIVSWYHFWQQSWLTPSIGRYSLDYLLRAGYMPVDGTILLSGFLLFLPYARTMMLGERVPDTKAFYQRRIMRIVPSYYFLTLLMLVAVAIPYNLYGRTSEAVRDVLMHLTFTQTSQVDVRAVENENLFRFAHSKCSSFISVSARFGGMEHPCQMLSASTA
jgi:peptidoglycan/LPS O-acetylase OafA/YrhL